MPLGTLTHEEILSQPQSWAAALKRCEELAERWTATIQTADVTVYVGCGTSYYLAQAAAAADRAISRRRAFALPASELLLYDDIHIRTDANTRLVLISRSGTTTEVVRVAERFAGRSNTPLVAVTCRSESTLAKAVENAFTFDDAFDRSIVMTRSFSTMLLALIRFAHESAAISGRLSNLEAAGERVLKDAAPLAQRLAQRGLQRFVFLAQGPLYGIAQEASLKMKEMSLSTSEPFHSLEERHGPKSVVDATTLVVVLTSERTARWENALIEELRSLGATCLTVGEGGQTTGEHIGFDTALDVFNRLPVYILPCQLLALEQARNKGVDPDHPRALAPVVDVELP
jgi:glucosamine--fructose-6-phosphate aminotransferase (isomerizing)